MHDEAFFSLDDFRRLERLRVIEVETYSTSSIDSPSFWMARPTIGQFTHMRPVIHAYMHSHAPNLSTCYCCFIASLLT